jgi:long-chain acyl-CoA synthetase
MNDRPWLNRYDEGVPKNIDYPNIPIHQMLTEAANKYPDSACTIFKGAKISYAEMEEITNRLAAGLASIGVSKGDRVGIFMPNTPQFAMAYFAVLKLGGIVVAINPLYSPREIEHQVNDAGIEIILVMSNFYNLIKEVQPKTKIRTVVATNIKEALSSILAFLFTLTQEKKGGFRIQLDEAQLGSPKARSPCTAILLPMPYKSACGC